MVKRLLLLLGLVTILTSSHTTTTAKTISIIESIKAHPETTHEEIQEARLKLQQEAARARIKEASDKLADLDDAELEHCYSEYRRVVKRYADIVDEPESLTDIYSDDEIKLLYQVIEAEVTGEGYFIEKTHVANAILNRLDNHKFHCDTLSDVLVKNQFASISDGRYKKVKVTDETKLAAEYAFEFGTLDTHYVFFENKSIDIHGRYAVLVMQDSLHKFFETKEN